jgi:hypothetical protein
MDDEFRIERYRRADREQVFDLMRAAYEPGEVALQVKQWDWKHDANPFNEEAERYRIFSRSRILSFVRSAARPEDLAALELQGSDALSLDQPYCLMLKTDAKLVGIFCMIPQRFMISGEPHWAIIGSNYVIHPAYRGRKFSIRMSLAMRADNALNLNFANPTGQRSSRSVNRTVRGIASAPDAAPNRAFSGTRRLTPLFKPLDWREVVRHVSSNAILNQSAALVGAGLEAARRKIFAPPSAREVTILEVDSFDDRIDALWMRVCHDYSVIAARDRRYLNWRFLARPDVSYRYLVACRGDDVVAYLVFRAADRDGMMCGYVIDYLIEDRSREVFSRLLEHAEKSMLRDGAKAIISAVAPASYRSLLYRQGYFPVRSATTPHLNALCHSSDPALEVFTDLGQWFVTAGDGNLDFSH